MKDSDAKRLMGAYGSTVGDRSTSEDIYLIIDAEAVRRERCEGWRGAYEGRVGEVVGNVAGRCAVRRGVRGCDAV